MSAQFQVFNSNTYHRRLSQARQVLNSINVDACVMIAPEHQFFFGGYDSWTGVNSPQAMIFTGNNDCPTLLLRNVDLSLATESAWVSDIRTYRLHNENFAERVRDILVEKGIDGGRVAVEMQSYAMPYSLGIELADALSPIEMVDATTQLGQLRLVKSQDEIALIKRAGHYANLGLQAMASTIKPGISEIALAAQVENALRKAGSDYWAIPVELASGNRSAGCHGTPRDKIIEQGDLVHAEFAGVSSRYHATAIQTMGCGKVSSHHADIYNIAVESLNAGVQAIVPGVSVSDVEEASLQPLVIHGFEDAAMMRFGYGIGIAYPPIWLETLQISREFDTPLQPGMAFVLHACLEFPEENLGVIVGGTYLLEHGGLRMLAGAGSAVLQ
jgi:Xaa-Pro aminopeptidase